MKADSLSLILAVPCLSTNVRSSSGCRCVQTSPHVRHARKGSVQETPRPQAKTEESHALRFKESATPLQHSGSFRQQPPSPHTSDIGRCPWRRPRVVTNRVSV